VAGMMVEEGRRRVVIEAITPEIDGGRFRAKRVVGEAVRVEADIFTDGHDAITAVLQHRFVGAGGLPAPPGQTGPVDVAAAEAAGWDEGWTETPMRFHDNDRWRGGFRVRQEGVHAFRLVAWVDAFETWRRDLKKRVEAGQDVRIDLRIGAALVRAAAERAGAGADRERLAAVAELLEAKQGPEQRQRASVALGEELAALVSRHAERRFPTVSHVLEVRVDRERARFSAWYELFPRSTAAEPGRHGTFKDVVARLPYVAELGFDVLYLPPIHPIGEAFRKGANNSLAPEPGEPGSPWAIGGEEGGHTAIHPELGTLEDFRELVEQARALGIDVALDIAYQVSPDHPYAREHQEWFRRRPDGTIQYAENPPKKYQDIYPFDFETDAWPALWEELRDVVAYWCRQGVRVFRVDNPHTKPFAFWEWLIEEIKREWPDALFLSEAFTRPKVMYRLAKLGFTQSYTYFAWRPDKAGLTEYLTELNEYPVREIFRPNFWPNTPDILTEQLQTGGRAMFISRFVLASTLTASYGIYGPAFELQAATPREPGSEEYLDSEKYQLVHWQLDAPHSLRPLIGQINRLRRGNPALHSNEGLRFHRLDNDRLIAYSKQDERGENLVLVVVNLDPVHTQSGWVELPLEALGLPVHDRYELEDLLTGARYSWGGRSNYVELNPDVLPAHILRLRPAPGPAAGD
jgi:starch synthase (maltosyl-transferring)